MSQSRLHAPSEKLLRAARAAGLFPRAEVIGIAAALSALTLSLAIGGTRAFLTLSAASRTLLADAAGAKTRTSALPVASLVAALPVSSLVSSLLWPLLATAGVGVFLRVVLIGGGGGSGPRLRFTREVPRTFVGRTLALFGMAGIVLHACTRFLALGTQGLATVLQAELVYLAVWFLLCAWVDAVFARAAFVRALHLTEREQRDEDRAEFGDPGVRQARKRAHSGIRP